MRKEYYGDLKGHTVVTSEGRVTVTDEKDTMMTGERTPCAD